MGLRLLYYRGFHINISGARQHRRHMHSHTHTHTQDPPVFSNPILLVVESNLLSLLLLVSYGILLSSFPGVSGEKTCFPTMKDKGWSTAAGGGNLKTPRPPLLLP